MERSEGRRGFALLFVVAVGAIISALAIGVLSRARSEAKLVADLRERLRIDLTLESGAQALIAELANAVADPTQSLDSGWRVFAINGLRVEARARPESAKVDLNLTEPPLLEAVIADSLGPQVDAEALAAAIADWRDEDDLARIHGAEAVEYQRAGMPPPANRPFLSEGELGHVLGIDDDVLACLGPLVTVHAHTRRPDALFAANPIKAALEGGSSNGAVAPNPNARMSPRPGDAFEIYVTVNNEGAALAGTRLYVVRVTGNPNDPIWILDIRKNVADPLLPAPECRSREARS